MEARADDGSGARYDDRCDDVSGPLPVAALNGSVVALNGIGW